MSLDRRQFLHSLGLGVLASSGLGGRWFRQTVIRRPRPVAWIGGAIKTPETAWAFRELGLTQEEFDVLAPVRPDGSRAVNMFDMAQQLMSPAEREAWERTGRDMSIDDLYLAENQLGPAWAEDCYQWDPIPFAPRPAGLEIAVDQPAQRLESFNLSRVVPERDPDPAEWGPGLCYAEGLDRVIEDVPDRWAVGGIAFGPPIGQVRQILTTDRSDGIIGVQATIRNRKPDAAARNVVHYLSSDFGLRADP